MLTSDERQMIRSLGKSLEQIAGRIKALESIAKILETMNTNLVMIGRDLVPPQTETQEDPVQMFVDGKPVVRLYPRMLPKYWRDEIGLDALSEELQEYASSEMTLMGRDDFLAYDEGIAIAYNSRQEGP